jgi:hypothetical protein
MTATLKSKQTSITTVRYHLLPVAILLTPLIFHYPLPLMSTFNSPLPQDESVKSNVITKYKMAASNPQEEVFPYLAPSLFPLLAIFLTGKHSGRLILKTAVTRNSGAGVATMDTTSKNYSVQMFLPFKSAEW